jgi:hypothetical protein
MLLVLRPQVGLLCQSRKNHWQNGNCSEKAKELIQRKSCPDVTVQSHTDALRCTSDAY